MSRTKRRDGSLIAASDRHRVATTLSSEALLRRLVHYGLRHGLDNHSIEQVREKAKALGVFA